LVLLSFLVVDVGGVLRVIAVAAGFGFFTVDAAVLLRVMMPGDDDDDGVMLSSRGCRSVWSFVAANDLWRRRPAKKK
jgi:hypothetical protein